MAVAVGTGSHLTKMFSAVLATADSKCLCRERAHLMDLWGPRLCRTNLETIIDWIEEEAKKRGLEEDKYFVEKTVRYVSRYLWNKYRFLRPFPRLREWIARREMSKSGKARRRLIGRIVMICIRRAERRQ